MNCNLALSLNPCLARAPRRALARGRQRRLQKKSTVVRSALSSKQPTEEGAGAPGVSSDAVADADAHPLAEQSHRHLKRMTVAQTRAVMEQLSGDIPWVDDSGNNLWDVYAETLGVADYQTRLKDNLDPSIMFQKFLDDAAVHTCDAWVVAEAADEASSGRFFTAAGPEATDPTSVAQNLVALRAIVHGETNVATDPIILNYANLFEVALRRTEDPTAAWTTVCVALFTHPDFFLY